MRRVLERYIVGSKSLSLYPADLAVWVEDENGYGLNGILDNQIVIYDADTGVSVGPGVTVETNRRLVIAQGIDTDGDGVANVLRKSAYDFIDAAGVSAATAEGPECGQVKILDVGLACMQRGDSVSLTIEARTGHTENFYNYNDYERFTETVQFDFDPCADCDQPLECKEVVCALANKFNAKDVKNSIKKQGSLIKRVKEHQLKDKPFHVYVLHENDYQFCFDTDNLNCGKCNTIDAITGIVVDGVTTEFNLTTHPDDATKSTTGQVKRVLKLINNVLSKDNVGYALDASTFVDSGKPCCDGVKLLINSCKVVELLGAGGAPIAPCETGLPTHEVVKNGECGACSTSSTETFCAFLRVVPKPISLDKFCDRPDSYQKTLYTDIRVTTSYNNNNIGKFKVFEFQPYKIPKNLAYQALHKVALQDTSANAPFSWGYDEFVGKYKNFLKGSRTDAMLHGLLGGCDSFDGLCVYNLEHSAFGKHQRVHGDVYSPRVRTTILIPDSNTAAKTEFEAIINPWLMSIGGFQAITCSEDQDQIERTYVFPEGAIDELDFPNANGKVL